jgi:hypothetical protein
MSEINKDRLGTAMTEFDRRRGNMADPTGIWSVMAPPGIMQPNTFHMIETMEKFLILRMQGYSIADCCTMCSIVRKTYEKWRPRYPEFRELCDSLVAQAKVDRNEPLRKDDFAGFRQRYFKMTSPPFHLRMIYAIEHSKPGSVTMILVPPNHGKTTLLTDWINMKLGYDPNHRILYISESSKLAAKVIGRVKRRMTDRAIAPQYMADFGPFYEAGQEKAGKPWAAEFMTVCNSTHDEQDYSLEAMGWVSQIYGVRSDTIVLDDYQTLRTAEKGNTTEAMVDKFQQDIYTRIDPEQGRIIIIGTRVAQMDFYVKLLDQGDVIDDVIVMPAIDWRGNALWEDRLPKAKLEQIRKKVGPKIWSRAYQMAPQDDGAATFQVEVLADCRRPDIKVGQMAEVAEDVWASIDPAIDKFTALTAAGVTPERLRLMLSEHYWELATGEAILSRIHTLWIRTHFSKLIVEAVSFQKALARDERLERMRRECGFSIVEHTTSSNKLDTTFGVARMASSFIDQTIWIPAADADSEKAFQDLIAELVQWRATIPTRLRTQDLVMSLWFLWVQWQKLRKDHSTQTREIATAGMPFHPTAYKAGMFRYGSVLR